jgi:drug/metabolite transporter (DMT)-like permease
MAAILLGLSCSLAWGVADYLAGVESRRSALSAVLVLSQTAGLLAALGMAIVSGEAFPSAATVGAAMVAGALLITAIAAFYRALTLGMMGVIAPIMATSAVIPVVAGIASGDRLNGLQIGGIGLCCVGVVLATRHRSGEPHEGRPVRRGGVGFAFVAMAAFGCFLVIFDGASSTSLFWSVAVTRAVAVGAVLGGIAVLRQRPHLPRRGSARVAVIGLLDICALTCFGLAADRGLLSVVAVLASLYPAVTVVMARVLLDERLARIQEIGVAGALVGVAALAAT